MLDSSFSRVVTNGQPTFMQLLRQKKQDPEFVKRYGSFDEDGSGQISACRENLGKGPYFGKGSAELPPCLGVLAKVASDIPSSLEGVCTSMWEELAAFCIVRPYTGKDVPIKHLQGHPGAFSVLCFRTTLFEGIDSFSKKVKELYPFISRFKSETKLSGGIKEVSHSADYKDSNRQISMVYLENYVLSLVYAYKEEDQWYAMIYFMSRKKALVGNSIVRREMLHKKVIGNRLPKSSLIEMKGSQIGVDVKTTFDAIELRKLSSSYFERDGSLFFTELIDKQSDLSDSADHFYEKITMTDDVEKKSLYSRGYEKKTHYLGHAVYTAEVSHIKEPYTYMNGTFLEDNDHQIDGLKLEYDRSSSTNRVTYSVFFGDKNPFFSAVYSLKDNGSWDKLKIVLNVHKLCFSILYEKDSNTWFIERHDGFSSDKKPPQETFRFIRANKPKRTDKKLSYFSKVFDLLPIPFLPKLNGDQWICDSTYDDEEKYDEFSKMWETRFSDSSVFKGYDKDVLDYFEIVVFPVNVGVQVELAYLEKQRRLDLEFKQSLLSFNFQKEYMMYIHKLRRVELGLFQGYQLMEQEGQETLERKQIGQMQAQNLRNISEAVLQERSKFLIRQFLRNRENAFFKKLLNPIKRFYDQLTLQHLEYQKLVYLNKMALHYGEFQSHKEEIVLQNLLSVQEEIFQLIVETYAQQFYREGTRLLGLLEGHCIKFVIKKRLLPLFLDIPLVESGTSLPSISTCIQTLERLGCDVRLYGSSLRFQDYRDIDISVQFPNLLSYDSLKDSLESLKPFIERGTCISGVSDLGVFSFEVDFRNGCKPVNFVLKFKSDLQEPQYQQDIWAKLDSDECVHFYQHPNGAPLDDLAISDFISTLKFNENANEKSFLRTVRDVVMGRVSEPSQTDQLNRWVNKHIPSPNDDERSYLDSLGYLKYLVLQFQGIMVSASGAPVQTRFNPLVSSDYHNNFQQLVIQYVFGSNEALFNRTATKPSTNIQKKGLEIAGDKGELLVRLMHCRTDDQVKHFFNNWFV